MAVLKSDKAMEYANYAEHCLEMVPLIKYQESRTILREMAAEWFKLSNQTADEDAALGAHATEPAKATKAGS